MKNKSTLLILLALVAGCSLWEYEDPSFPIENQAPETYLSLIASDTLYLAIQNEDTLWAAIDFISYDSTTQTYDTTWTYLTLEPETHVNWVAVGNAFETITTSRQELYWWGEDADGYVVGYRYRWGVNSPWTYTVDETALFYVPITTDLDVFSFEVVAVDNDSLADETPAILVLPIQNSSPSISFRYRSNPLSDDLPTDTSFTFPTRTFVWDVEDQDGIETITTVYYALDDTCDTCWSELNAAAHSSVTLTDLVPGLHSFYLKVRDIAGAESETIVFPDVNDPTTVNYWKVISVKGDVLLVDDFSQDSQNKAQDWYRNVLDSLLGSDGFSVWEIGEELPYSTTDLNANLNYFNTVIWYSAYTGNETYGEAGSSIYAFLSGGGNIFVNAPELKDTSFVWFPIDSTFTLNPSGRLLTGRVLESQIDSTLNLEVSRLIAIRVKGYENNEEDHPYFQSLYRLQEPGGGDEWNGTPNVCASYQFEVGVGQLSGKAVLMTLPLHNGSKPVLEGNGSAGKFLGYLLEEEFTP